MNFKYFNQGGNLAEIRTQSLVTTFEGFKLL